MTESPTLSVGNARTPMGGFHCDRRDVPAPELGSVAIQAAFARAGVVADAVDEVIMGCVLAAVVGAAAGGLVISAF